VDFSSNFSVEEALQVGIKYSMQDLIRNFID